MNSEIPSSHFELENMIISIEDLINWLDNENLTSYDPFDIQSSRTWKILNNSTFFPIRLIKKYLIILEKLFPRFIRIFSHKTKASTSVALFASSCAMIYQIDKNEKLLRNIQDKLNWLEENKSEGYSGYCWGLPFKWYLPENIVADINTPCSTILIYIMDAFLLGHKLTGNDHYKEVALSISNFLIKDLNKDIIDEKTICSSYTPLDNFHVINVNSYVAATLYTLFSYSKNKNLIEYSDKLINYVIKEQNEDGSWFYWEKNEKSKDVVDSLHQCYIIENLYRCYLINKDKRIFDSIQKCLDYFIKNLYRNGQIKKFTDEKYKDYPLELIDHAEAITMFTMLSNDFNTKKYAEKTVNYVFQKFKIKNKSYFYSYIIKSIPKDIPYIRWGESQILYALSFYYCIFIKRLSIEKLLFP